MGLGPHPPYHPLLEHDSSEVGSGHIGTIPGGAPPRTSPTPTHARIGFSALSLVFVFVFVFCGGGWTSCGSCLGSSLGGGRLHD